ncbi:hypothetical protein EVAR_17799_1 [Eumeta japonica]|uniref:Uncharacterized protein n=1 Tax=Eumeta variegata TaxID=151549 RepID=A0A4C1TTG5_EUMVA|nr:hypothetical protein EVAR_17799_1 [Eumeta japonica]
MLYVSRALKSTWLVTDAEYTDIINPQYLEEELFPKMLTTGKHKDKYLAKPELYGGALLHRGRGAGPRVETDQGPAPSALVHTKVQKCRALFETYQCFWTRHANEPSTLRASFLRSLVRRVAAYRLPEEPWQIFQRKCMIAESSTFMNNVYIRILCWFLLTCKAETAQNEKFATVVEEMHTFLDVKWHFKLYSCIHLTMVYYKTLQHLKQQQPTLFSEQANGAEVASAVGLVFGRYLAREHRQLLTDYFHTITDIYVDDVVDYTYNLSNRKYLEKFKS